MIGIPNRPFATEPITGMMLPDGFFEASIGVQSINAHFQNDGSGPVDAQLYFESASHPAFLVTAETFTVSGLAGGASYLGTWTADVSGVPPGVYQVSFIARTSTGQTRIIKKVFVTRVTFNPATNTLGITAPEGSLGVQLTSVLGPRVPCGSCGDCGGRDTAGRIDEGRDAMGRMLTSSSTRTIDDPATVLGQLKPLIQRMMTDPSCAGCPPFSLLKDGVMTVAYNEPFAGQYGDLPYQDPWWKTLLLILAVILAIAAIVVASVASGGTVAVAGASIIATCCTGTGASILFGALGAGAVGSGAAAAFSDARDPFRRGEDNTMPAAGELTTGEAVKFSISYPEPVALGRPFKVDVTWDYTRTTTGNTYSYSVSETNTNVHVLSDYEITAPNIVRVYKEEPFLVKGRFFDEKKKLMRGNALYVQCFLVGTGALQGRYIRFPMQDNGVYPDTTATDGTYTGIHYFRQADHGYWQIYVVAQDVNNAQPNMTPEQAAQIIGGQIRTHQLTVDFQGGTCPHVPDGEVHVLSNLGS